MDWKSYIKMYLKNRYNFEYRKTPVPGTGKDVLFHRFRKIRTTQERKWNEAHKDTIKIRGNRKNIPDSWEDFPRDYQRCWKKQRKTQYK